MSEREKFQVSDELRRAEPVVGPPAQTVLLSAVERMCAECKVLVCSVDIDNVWMPPILKCAVLAGRRHLRTDEKRADPSKDVPGR
jgi:hypothetical protein